MPDKFVTFKNVDGKNIIYKNFDGHPTKYVTEGGKREFSVIFDDPSLAEAMIDDGWNVRKRVDKNGNVETYIGVKIHFGGYNPPVIDQVTEGGGRVKLDEELAGSLQYAEIVNVNYVTIRGWEYEPGKRSAYLVRMEVEIDECLDSYRDVSTDDEIPF